MTKTRWQGTTRSSASASSTLVMLRMPQPDIEWPYHRAERSLLIRCVGGPKKGSRILHLYPAEIPFAASSVAADPKITSCRTMSPMPTLVRIGTCLIEDIFRWALLLFGSTKSVQAENLFPRRQLASFQERGVRPRRQDPASRVSLAVLARLFEWRNALVVVQRATVSRW